MFSKNDDNIFSFSFLYCFYFIDITYNIVITPNYLFHRIFPLKVL